MGQPVKLSDELVAEARIAASSMQRSIAGQVEFWAKLGMTMERLMTGRDARRGASSASSLAKSLEEINGPVGRARFETYMQSKPFPRFLADPSEPRIFIREDMDGTRTRGRIANRQFHPLAESSSDRP